ncbi:MAG: hypothetical protein IKK49_02395 [Clostridia bacterium]|nr:hypothetical protein [Clostridia bacterium]
MGKPSVVRIADISILRRVVGAIHFLARNLPSNLLYGRSKPLPYNVFNLMHRQTREAKRLPYGKFIIYSLKTIFNFPLSIQKSPNAHGRKGAAGVGETL